MVTFKALLSFNELNRPNLSTYAHNVSLAMTGNPLFSNPPFPMSELDAAVTDLNIKNALAYKGSKLQTSDANAAKVVVQGKLRILVPYVNGIANGDENIIISAGLTPNKVKVPLSAPVKVTNLSASRTDSVGTMTVQFDKAINALWYVLFISLDPNFAIPFVAGTNRFSVPSGVTEQFSTKSEFTVTSLLSNVPSYFIVYALNTAGWSPVSDVATDVPK